MIERATEYLMDWCIRNNRVIKITGTSGDPEDIYLIRYFLVRSRFFNVFIHQFLRSDRDDLHDHPWNFMTYLVRGSYTEKKWDDKTQSVKETYRLNWFPSYLKKRVKVETLVFRRAEDQHMVIVEEDLKEKDKVRAPLTICVTGRTRREWGFWKWIPKDGLSFLIENLERDLFGCKDKANPLKRCWVDWRTYLGLPPDTKGRG